MFIAASSNPMPYIICLEIISFCFINMNVHLECHIIEQRNIDLIASESLRYSLYQNSSDFKTSKNVKI